MAKFSVKKPFTVLVGVIMILALGIVSLTRMTTDLLPNMTLPYMMVITTYPGASPEQVENNVTQPLESALGTINGVKNVTSSSAENFSLVQLEFEDGTDLDAALVKVSTSLDTVTPNLPELCGTPSIMELSMDMMATMYLSVSHQEMDIYQLSEFVEDTLVGEFERKDGVASVSTNGLIEKSIQIELNKDKITALNDRILASVDAEFADALKDMEEARQTLLDSQKELDDGRKELADSRKDLEEGQLEMEDALEELKDTNIYANLDKMTLMLDGMEQFAANLPTMKTQREGLVQTVEDLTVQVEGLRSLKTALSQFAAGFDPADDVTLLTAEQLTALEGMLANVPGAPALPPSLTAKGACELIGGICTSLDTTLQAAENGLTQATDGLAVLDQSFAQLDGLIAGYDAMLKGFGMAASGITKDNLDQSKVNTARMQVSALLGSADAQLAYGKQQLESAKEQLESGFDQLDDAADQLKTAQEQIDDGWESYNDGLKTFNKQRQQALLRANADQLLTLETLAQLVYAQNFEMPAGYIDDKEDNSWLLKVGESYASLDEISGTVLCNINKVGDVRLCDVADITVIDNAAESYARMNGQSAVILSVFKSSTTGTNAVSKACTSVSESLTERYPGLEIIPLMDQGDYINIIVDSVTDSMVIGAALAVVILAIFLKDVLPTLVVAISIPLSVLFALVLMYFTNITLNMLTLSGLALGIGMLVDNSIVVIENIYRLRNRGISAPRAAVQGTRQVSGAIISSTLTTICVFMPMVFSSGTVREMIIPMSLTIAFCLGASLFIAMTVVPAAGSTLLRRSKPKDHPFFDKLQNLYARSLAWCLKVKILPLMLAFVLLAVSIWQVLVMGIVMLPGMTTNQVSVSVSMPEDMDRETAYKTADQVMEAIIPLEGVESVGAMTAGSMMSMISSDLASGMDSYLDYAFYVTLENENAGEAEVEALNASILDVTKDMDCTVTTTSDMDLSSLMASGLSINIFGKDLDTLQSVCEDVMEIVEGVEGYEDISNGQEDGDQVVHLMLDKNKAMSLGLSVAQIYQQLAAELTVEATSTTVTVDGVEMDVVIKDQVDPVTMETLMDYTFDVSVTDEDNDTITEQHTLGEFATIRHEKGVAGISRSNQSRYMTVTASVADGYNATLLARQLQPMLEQYQAPEGYEIRLGGESDAVNEMVDQMLQVLALGLLFIYLIMVAQFQSLLSPFIVLFTVPLAFTGGLFGLLFMGEPLSMIGLLGFVILMGTVVNNGIVFVDYANQLRLGGMERRAALIATGKTRMRPILMTALTTILAMSKLVAGDDMGSQMGRGMAIVIIGGLAYATFMTLYIIPIMYDILFKRAPLQIDLGSENLDDVPDDATEFIQQAREEALRKAETAPEGGV